MGAGVFAGGPFYCKNRMWLFDRGGDRPTKILNLKALKMRRPMLSLNACSVLALTWILCKILFVNICFFNLIFTGFLWLNNLLVKALLILLPGWTFLAFMSIRVSTIIGTDERFQKLNDLLTGSSDTVVQPTVVRSLVQYYQNYLPSSSIKGQFNIASQHCLPTTNFGSA